MEPNIYIPLITAVVTPVVIWALNWVGTGGEIRKMNLHKTNLEVISKLLQLEKEHGPSGIKVDRQLVEAEISKILNDMKEIKEEVAPDRCDYEKLNFFRKAFLLFKPIGIGGWILHLYFYQAIVLGIYGFLELLTSHAMEVIPDPVFFVGRQVVSFLIFAFALRFWAVHLYIKRSAKKSAESSPPATPSE